MELKEFVKERFYENFTYVNIENIFEDVWKVYQKLPSFKINENWNEAIPGIKECLYKEELHFIIRTATQYYLTKAFEAMKIDLDDPNVAEDLQNGNIGTPGRVAKMWCGADLHDDRELMNGRFTDEIRLAKFPNTSEKNIPIIKEIDLMAVCSHHLAPFGTLVGPKAKVIIAYIPDEFVLGISKLQRVVRQIAQRGWLQEDLTKEIYKKLSEVAETESVYVKLKNIEHTCEKFRGAMTQGQGFTTEYYGGKFNKKKYLEMVRKY